MRTKPLLAIIGLVVSIVPTFYFLGTLVLVAGIYLLFSEQTWQANRFGEVWLSYRGGAVGFQPVMVIVGGCFTVVFFVCLRILLRIRKEMKEERQKIRDTYTV